MERRQENRAAAVLEFFPNGENVEVELFAVVTREDNFTNLPACREISRPKNFKG